MTVHTQLATWSAARAAAAGPIGFVPTMGGLHAGHRALLARARADNARVVLSIFVNPTQFDDPADLAAYPRDLAADLKVAAGLVDDVLVPGPGELYPGGYRYRVTETKVSRELEGAHRPGHFDGVLTVVLKLLHLVRPDRAYFGEKDWQQLELVRGLVADLFLPVEIVACPTERDPDGLALSSRNRRLAGPDRRRAAQFPLILRTAPNAGAAQVMLAGAGFAVDYVQDRDGRRLGAVRLGDVRLIDNVAL